MSGSCSSFDTMSALCQSKCINDNSYTPAKLIVTYLAPVDKTCVKKCSTSSPWLLSSTLA